MTIDSEARIEEQKPHTFTLLPPGTPCPPRAQITSASGVVFDRDGQLVAANLAHRGLDIPGGHLESDDENFATTEQSIEAAIRREAREEIWAELGDLLPVGIIQSSMLRDGQPTYMVVMAGRVCNFNEVKLSPDEKSLGRVILSPADFLKQNQFSLMPDLVARAQEIFWREFLPVRTAVNEANCRCGGLIAPCF